MKNVIPPQGFAIAAKFEWFVNDVSVKTTTEATDPVLVWPIQSRKTIVYCKVTYKDGFGKLSKEYISTSFTPNVKQLNFAEITSSTPAPDYGCTANIVTYNLVPFVCIPDLCSITHTVGQYSIAWQAPGGWQQVSISPNGSTVSFLPDATTGGAVTATITLACGTSGPSYKDTRTFEVSRRIPTPAFTNPNVEACGSSTTMSIVPVCGAANYTFSVSGSAGVTFTSNGQQSLTTTNTSVALSLSGGSSVNIVRVKANYPNGVSSAENTATLTVGLPPTPITNINGTTTNPQLMNPAEVPWTEICYLKDFTVTVDNPRGTEVWERTYANPTNTLYTPNEASLSLYFYGVGQQAIFRVSRTNSCGTSAIYLPVRSIDCNGGVDPCNTYYQLSPNPASSDVVVIMIPPPCESEFSATTTFGSTQTNLKTTMETKPSSIQKVTVFDVAGNMKMYRVFGKGTKQAKVDVSNLKRGSYWVEIADGKHVERKQLLITK